MGCLNSKEQYSRNYLLDCYRRQIKYGVSVENIEKFWSSEQLKLYCKEISKTNPDKSILENNIACPDSYIDCWNTWKKIYYPGVEDMPYTKEMPNIYYEDMFREILDLILSGKFRINNQNQLKLYIPKLHNSNQFNTIYKFYSNENRRKEILSREKVVNLSDYVNALLDQNEYSELINKIIEKYGIEEWNISQNNKIKRDMIKKPIIDVKDIEIKNPMLD